MRELPVDAAAADAQNTLLTIPAVVVYFERPSAGRRLAPKMRRPKEQRAHSFFVRTLVTCLQTYMNAQSRKPVLELSRTRFASNVERVPKENEGEMPMRTSARANAYRAAM